MSKTETRQVPAFTRIDNSLAAAIEVTTKQSPTLEITGDENIVPEIKTEVVGGTLILSHRTMLSSWSSKVPVRLKISVQTLETVANSGVGDISVFPLEGTTFRAEMSGAGSINATGVKVSTMSVDVSGVGKVQMQGSAERADISLSGAGNIQARELALQRANVSVSGVGSAYVSVSQVLDAVVSGAGNVIYYGSPSTISRTVTGVGSIRRGE